MMGLAPQWQLQIISRNGASKCQLSLSCALCIIMTQNTWRQYLKQKYKAKW